MKYIQFLWLLVLVIGPVETSQAQLFKKITDRASKAVERTILNKTDQKVSQKVSKGIDDVVDGKPGVKTVKNSKRSKEKATYQDSYSFSHQYVMNISGDQMPQEVQFTYYLAPNGSYTGMRFDQQGNNMFTVIDPKQQAIHSFIQAAGQKIASTTSTRFEGLEEEMDTGSHSDYQIQDLPDKTIAGMICTGKKLEDEKNTIVIYTTKVDGVHLNLFESSKAQVDLPEAIKSFLNEDRLIMYMELTEKNRKNNKMIMECTELKKEPFTFSTKDYKSFM